MKTTNKLETSKLSNKPIRRHLPILSEASIFVISNIRHAHVTISPFSSCWLTMKAFGESLNIIIWTIRFSSTVYAFLSGYFNGSYHLKFFYVYFSYSHWNMFIFLLHLWYQNTVWTATLNQFLPRRRFNHLDNCNFCIVISNLSACTRVL